MRILIVEDEPKVAGFLKKGLEEENCSVRLAFDGQQGLELVQCSQFDVIVLDIMLPKVDGLTVLKIMRKQKIDTPVLLLTARDSNIVDVYINHLRKKIDDPFGKPLIKTVRGFGYKLEAADEN